MKFFYEGADISKVIKSYQKNGYEYIINYMDGSFSRYVSYNENEEELIKEKMITQAKERDALYDKKSLNEIPNIHLVGAMVSLVGLGVSEATESYLIKLISLFFLGFNISRINTNRKKRKELEKYKLFLELIDNVDEKELNSSKYTRAYEFDNIYAKTLSINTLDEFSLKEIKDVYKVYSLGKK